MISLLSLPISIKENSPYREITELEQGNYSVGEEEYNLRLCYKLEFNIVTGENDRWPLTNLE